MNDPSVRRDFLASAGQGIGTGSQVALYMVEGQVGRGGMAVVFRARDLRLGRIVALKVLAPAVAADEDFRQRFIRESRAAAAVDDPHIIPVFEAGEASGVLFIAMRYVGGGDVRSLLRRIGPLTAMRAAGVISPVASALDAAHAAGLVHRDVKPANMLLDSRPGRPDHVYLSDFGLSKGALSSTGLTGTGMFLGTPDYIAPEQITGRPVDGRADQYALACAAFELLSGAPPFQRDHGMAVVWAHTAEPPPELISRRPGLPPAVDKVLARALAKEPEYRYPTCLDFANALRAALEVGPYDAGIGTSQEEHAATVVALTAANDVVAAPGKTGDFRSAAERADADWSLGFADSDAKRVGTSSMRGDARAALTPTTTPAVPVSSALGLTASGSDGDARIAETRTAWPGPADPAVSLDKARRRRRILAAVSALVLIGAAGGLTALLSHTPVDSHPVGAWAGTAIVENMARALRDNNPARFAFDQAALAKIPPPLRFPPGGADDYGTLAQAMRWNAEYPLTPAQRDQIAAMADALAAANAS